MFPLRAVFTRNIDKFNPGLKLDWKSYMVWERSVYLGCPWNTVSQTHLHAYGRHSHVWTSLYECEEGGEIEVWRESLLTNWPSGQPTSRRGHPSGHKLWFSLFWAAASPPPIPSKVCVHKYWALPLNFESWIRIFFKGIMNYAAIVMMPLLQSLA